jgi:hypothetical protein
MPLKEPNLYNVFDVRIMDFCPSHFDTTTLYDGKITSMVKVGFEDPKELSFFMLACPHLKYT